MEKLDDLIKQVDAFIRKYYKNQIIKGVLLFLLLFCVSYLFVVGLEYIGRFSSGIRAFLLFAFLLANVLVLVKFIIIPLSKLFSFGKRIDRYQAAQIIGKFFPDVNDRLLNTLQLNDAMHYQQANLELLKASVSQNAKKLTIFSFPSAIDYSENRKYLKYLLPIFLCFLIIGIMIPTFFKDGTERLVRYNQVFEEEAPFTFEILNNDLLIEDGSSITINVKLIPKEGGEIPNRIYIEGSEGRFLMKQNTKNTASYTFQKIKNGFQFNFLANGFRSNSFNIDVVGRASIGQLKASLNFPNYLDMPNQSIDNSGDLIVPEGTLIEWNGITKNTDEFFIGTKDSLHYYQRSGFRFSKKFVNSDRLFMVLVNKELDKKDTVFHTIEVIKDAYPEITVSEEQDSINPKRIKLSGVASDDHGINAVTFTFEINSKNGETVKEVKNIPNITGTRSSFSMIFDLNKLSLSTEDNVSYYFTVYDNDAVNGQKATRSHLFKYTVLSAKELNEKRSKEKEQTKEDLQQLLNESKEFNEKMERLKMDLLNTKNPSWKEQQQVEQLKEQRSSLQERLEKLNNEMKNSFQNKMDLSPMDENLLEQQELLEELMNDVMDDELKDLLDKLQELLEKQQTDGLQDIFEEAETSAENMERQMDRTMEMLKKMDVEERIDDIEQALEDLAEEQEQLLNDIANDEIKNDEAIDKQEELNKKFDDIQKDIDEMLSKNEELKRPLDLDELSEDRQSIEEEMEEAKDNLEKNDSKKANDNQQNASDKMKQMSSKMDAMKTQSKQDQQQEDMESLRALLENLLKMSFDQEDNMEAFKYVSVYNPSYGQLGREQRSIIDNMKHVEDSLRALADRIPKISTFVNSELAIINQSYHNLIDDIDERRKQKLGVKQQIAMTSINNLALFLNESLQAMQNDMQGDKSGDGSCDNPGGKGKGSEGDEMQNIKEMLKKQLEEMEKGNTPGGEKPSIKLPFGNKEAAKVAAQQSAMRKKLEEMRKELNKDGKGKGNELNDLLKELEDQEENIVNKKWDEKMIQRQKDILTRLLESEKALEERGFDEERESNVGKDEDFSNQIEFLEYKKQKEKQIELLRTLDPTFSKYYRDRANDYFNLIY